MLVTCVYVLIGATELWLCPWLPYQAFWEVNMAVTRASLSGSDICLKTHRCCRLGASKCVIRSEHIAAPTL